MELKNQILLVILIPILLILCLAVLQVGLLGFVNIPTFQNALLEFHIERHVSGLDVEMSIIQQEIYVKNQAYFNQILGIAAHLRYYSFGSFASQNVWEFKQLNVPEQSLLMNVQDAHRSLDWYHPRYSTLKELEQNDPESYQLLMKSSQSLHLGDILINHTPYENVDFIETNLTIMNADTNDTQYIGYEYMQVLCDDGFQIRYPALNELQLSLIAKAENYTATSFEGYEVPKAGGGKNLNFTLSAVKATPFSNETGVLLQQVIGKRNSKGAVCVLNTKIRNNYLDYVTTVDAKEHNDQYHSGHQIFIGLYDQAFSNLAPTELSNRTMAEAIYRKFDTSVKDSKQDVSKISEAIVDLVQQIQKKESQNKSNGTGNFVQQNVNGKTLYLIVHLIDTQSDKTFDEVTDPETGKKYLHISPLTNNYELPTFVMVHVFDRASLINDLYNNNSLNNVKILEIVVFVAIVLLSIIIFIFVYFTATRIGLSFESPIRVLTEFMNSIDIQNMEQEEELMAYEDYFNSFEIRALFKTMNIFVTTIKYSNQKYSNSKHSDAIALMELSKAKDFYKKEIGNMSAVGICANNIGILHMKGQRVFEAVNEMEEAIFIAKQELQEIKELKQWCKRMILSYQEPNFISNFKAKVQGLANRVRQIEFNFITRLQRRKSESIKRPGKSSSRYSSMHGTQKVTQTVSKNLSITQLNSKSAMPHIALLANRNTPLQSGNNTHIHSGNATPKAGFQQFQAEQFRRERGDAKANNDKAELISMEQDQLSPHTSPHQTQNKNKYFAHSQNQSSIIQSQRVDVRESILNDGKPRLSMAESIRENGNFQNNQTEMDMLDDKILELKKKKQLARAKLQNRQFQLALFMFNICMHYSDVFIPETLSLFEQFEAVSDKLQKQTTSKLVRMINLHVKKALCYIQIGDIQLFKNQQMRAQELYDRLEKEGQQLDQSHPEESDFNFVDMFKNVPLEVLKSKIMQLGAIYELLRGNFQSSARILTEIIELGEFYDPEVRDFCLVLLENIFKLFNIPTQSIKQFQGQISINVYEIVIMIDYSKEMSIEQINLSHSIAAQIFQILQPQDLVGMYGFNNSLHEAFPLQSKGTYQDLLQKQLYMAITAPGGNSRLYKALKFAVTNIFEHRTEFHQQLAKVDQQMAYQNQSPGVPKLEKSVETAKVDSSAYSESGIVQDEADEHESNRGQSPSSDESSSSEEYKFIKANDPDLPPRTKNPESRNSYKYICLFTEINRHPTQNQQAKLQRYLLENEVDLLVFNIANQNANMLDLKQLSKITPRSMFVNANASLENIFGKSRQNQLQKKMYLEFF